MKVSDEKHSRITPAYLTGCLCIHFGIWAPKEMWTLEVEMRSLLSWALMDLGNLWCGCRPRQHSSGTATNCKKLTEEFSQETRIQTWRIVAVLHRCHSSSCDHTQDLEWLVGESLTVSQFRSHVNSLWTARIYRLLELRNLAVQCRRV